MDTKDLKQPWKSISAEYRNAQDRLDRETGGLSRLQVPEGQLVLKGGTGTAQHDASSWKNVYYDTNTDTKSTEKKS
jgi:hypothetical protein